MLGYDRSGVISALIKSIRGSDPDAAVWWLATALEAGEDPRYLARRLVISASEDVGNAEPAGLPLAVAALTAVDRIGAETNDEGLYALVQAAIFLAAAPKSAAAGRAFFAARDELRAHGPSPVPGHLRAAAKTYRNPHDDPDGAADQEYLPRRMASRSFWEPTGEGAEARLGELLAELLLVGAERVEEHGVLQDERSLTGEDGEQVELLPFEEVLDLVIADVEGPDRVSLAQQGNAHDARQLER